MTLTHEERRGTRAVAVLLGLAVLGGVVWVLLPGMLGAAGGPEPQLISVLRTAELARSPIVVPGAAPLEPRSLRFDRFSVTVDGDQAVVVSTLDASGRSGNVDVSSLGREKLRFVRRDGRWQPEGPLAPALAGALEVLWRRASLLSGSSVAALGPLVVAPDRARSLADARLEQVLRVPAHRWEPRAWYLRSERGEVLVTEEAVLTSPSRSPEPRTGRLRLVSSDGGGSFVFAGTLL